MLLHRVGVSAVLRKQRSLSAVMMFRRSIIFSSSAAAARSTAPCMSSRHCTCRMYSASSLSSTKDYYFQSASVPTTKDRVLLGCVSYDPAVGDIWDQMKTHLRAHNIPTFDYVLFTNYEQQVRALLNSQIDIAWNGPLAHVLCAILVALEKPDDAIVSLGMRDVDCDFESILVTRKDVTCLENTCLLAGACDWPQAYVVPKYALQEIHGMSWCRIEPQNVDVGKHGDTALGEIQAMQKLVANNNDDTKYDGALLSRMMWDRAITGQLDGVDADKLQDEYHIYTDIDFPRFDHCQFDALASNVDDNDNDKLERFYTSLHAMDYNDPVQQPIMKLEGIQKSWAKPRQEGYDIIRSAAAAAMATGQRGSSSAFPRAQNYTPPSSSGSSRSLSTSTVSSSTTSHTHHHKPVALQPDKSRIGIIGCGVAGLQVIRSLRANGFQHVTAFDKANDVGGLWRDNYDGYALQVGKQFFEMPDLEMTEAEWQELASGPKVQAYIERFAKTFQLLEHCRLNTGIERVMHNPADDTWTFTTDAGKEHVFDYCVVCTGMYSTFPRFPTDIPGQDTFSGSIIHSSQFRNAQECAKDKNVVVVGGGKSATDCSTSAALSKAAKSATLVQRKAHWPAALYIAGIIPFQYVFLSRLGQALVEAKVGVLPGSSSSSKSLASYFSPIMGPIFRLVEELFAFQMGLKGDLRPKAGIVEDFYGCAAVQDGSFYELRDAGKVQVKLGQIERFTPDGVQVDGQEIPADVVIFATGFTKDYSTFFEPNVMERLNVQNDGLYLYKRILPPSVPGLAFVGSECATIFNCTNSGLQAEWLARLLSGDETMMQTLGGDLSEEAMDAEVQAFQSFARSFMPETTARSSSTLLHQLHYYDQLLMDMGENPSRKSNPMAEYLGSYYSRDYDNIVGHSSSSRVEGKLA